MTTSEQHPTKQFIFAAAHPDAHGVLYVPFVDYAGGTVGLACTRAHHINAEGATVDFLYFNPSSDDDEGVSNVFVYQGPSGDPALDMPHHYYRVLED